MIDTHVHLCDKRFRRDQAEVIARARDAGVTHLVEIACTPEVTPRAFELARAHAFVFLCVGVHPGDAGRVPEDYLATLRESARHPRVVAIGETGLDFYREHAPRPDQERWFRAQLRLADELGLPVVIHQRSALRETLAILEEARPSAGGVLHCFDDALEAAERAHALGFKLGLGGVLTYGHAALDQAAAQAPPEMLVLETDSPYLEPGPRSLKRNEPALLRRVLPRLAALRRWTPEQADRVTTANARELFRLPIAVEGGPWPAGAAGR